ncbi:MULTISPECIES: hypothetical protein [Catenuloplanes]|uniref:Uncharacterized protein n=1 Tax=Catenuloplanes niger TaxID=587534 RepID=A0AAE3ZML4_9ACTN|nr:hypothetical protein [Catenuloplanes niger]MDR7320888.1 hypothetical protein [Catenuloplanes niger]
MDASMKDLDRLAVLDPARGREPGPVEWARAEASLERTIAGTPKHRPAPRRWMIAGTVAVAAGVAGAVVVPALLPGTAERAVAAWTAAPATRTGEQVMAQAAACAALDVGGVTTAAPDDVLLAEQRGVATLLIMRKGDTVVECLSVGDDGFATMSLTDSLPQAPPAGWPVNLETMSSFGSRDNMWSNVVGLAGPDVTGIDVRTDDGRVVHASVRSGWWAAWWPGSEGGEVDAIAVTVHTADGSTTHRPSQLP